MKRISLLLFCVLIACSCTSKPPAQVEKPISKDPVKSVVPSAERVPSRPPSLSEVQAALQRIFGDAVVAVRLENSFVSGDFNGDGSPDLAAIVHPVKTNLAIINDEFANWTIQDANQAFTPPVGERVVFRAKGSRSAVQASDVLLAVIHGYGREGWRDDRARQAYLIRHAAVGPLRTRMVRERVENDPASMTRSDLIYEGSANSKFLFWTGSQYAWHSKLGNAADTKRSE